MNLNIKAMALAGGILWAAGNFVAGIMAMYGWGQEYVAVIGSVYIGYGPTIVGSLIGAGWAFADGLIGAAVFAWIYNKLAAKCSC